MTIDEARELALRHAKSRSPERVRNDIVIMEEFTEERARGWIFSYQTGRWLETKKTRDGLIGNGPILIDKNTGKIVVFGSAGSTDYWYELYEKGKTREDKDGVIHLLFREDLRERRKNSVR